MELEGTLLWATYAFKSEVGQSFSTDTKDLFTGFIAIKRILERGRAFSLDVISFFSSSGLQLNTVSVDMFTDSGLEFFDEERQFITVNGPFNLIAQ